MRIVLFDRSKLFRLLLFSLYFNFSEAGEGDQSLDRDSACRFPTIITHKTDAVNII